MFPVSCVCVCMRMRAVNALTEVRLVGGTLVKLVFAWMHGSRRIVSRTASSPTRERCLLASKYACAAFFFWCKLTLQLNVDALELSEGSDNEEASDEKSRKRAAAEDSSASLSATRRKKATPQRWGGKPNDGEQYHK